MSERPQNARHHQSKSLHKTDDYLCTLLFQQLEQSDLPDKCKLIRRLKSCAQYRRNGLNSGKKPNYCNLRYLCETCSEREAQRYAVKYADKILELMIRFELCPYFMTLRPEAGIDLVQQLSQLNDYLMKIQQQRSNYFYHGKRRTEFCRFHYALLMLEVTRANDIQFWRPHVHAIVLNPSSNRPFNLPELATDWRKISGLNIAPRIEHVKVTNQSLNRNGFQNPTVLTQGTIFRSLKRMIKYSFKMVKDQIPLLCPSDQITVYSAMRRRQRIREWTAPENYFQSHISKL